MSASVKPAKPAKPKIAGAPISWGVCEVPGWGPMLEAERVLRELRSLGLDAIELGAPGFLPSDVGDLNAMLHKYEVRLVGGFVPVVLHDPSQRTETLRQANQTAELFAAAGADTFVSAVVVDWDWAPRQVLDVHEKAHLISMFAELDILAANHGLQHVLHPHVNTLVETREDVQFVLDETDVQWCLDTGHLAVGGYDPVEFAQRYASRIGHVHVKDADLSIAKRLNDGELTLMNATIAGMFRSLGEGDIDIASTMQLVLESGYDKWIVLEQDTSIIGDAPPEGSGPVKDIAVSLAFVQSQMSSFELAR